MFFLIWALLSIVPLSIANSANKNTTLASYICDDEELKKIVFQIDMLDTAVKNLNYKLDSFNLKIDQQFGELKAAIAVISKSNESQETTKTANTTETDTKTACYSYSYGHLIDVRWGVDEQCDTKTIATTTTTTHLPVQLLSASSISTISSGIPSNCQNRQTGIHLIKIPNSKIDPFYIYCLEDPQQDGASWMLIQRRRNGKTDFYRNWNDYQVGFGNLENEFFIGLNKLHALTQFTSHELWIQLEDFANETRWARYGSFVTGDESESYALKELGSYTGNAGDSLTVHVGQNFTTKDVDNDRDDNNNCAVTSTGAWWYKDCLYKSNLNGKYFGKSFAMLKISKGIEWETWHGYYYSLKCVHMALRPLQ